MNAERFLAIVWSDLSRPRRSDDMAQRTNRKIVLREAARRAR